MGQKVHEYYGRLVERHGKKHGINSNTFMVVNPIRIAEEQHNFRVAHLDIKDYCKRSSVALWNKQILDKIENSLSLTIKDHHAKEIRKRMHEDFVKTCEFHGGNPELPKEPEETSAGEATILGGGGQPAEEEAKAEAAPEEEPVPAGSNADYEKTFSSLYMKDKGGTIQRKVIRALLVGTEREALEKKVRLAVGEASRQAKKRSWAKQELTAHEIATIIHDGLEKEAKRAKLTKGEMIDLVVDILHNK